MSATSSETFSERFLARAEEFGPVCVGIDPHAELLRAWELPDTPEGLEQFSRTCAEAFAEVACVVKPQVAFYERFGSAGFRVLEETISFLRSRGVLVIADAKRGDIGSTMAGYASAWLSDESPLCADAVTVSPWLGFGSLAPVIELGERHNRGVIVLAATSNPEAPEVQRSRTVLPDGQPTDETLAQSIVNQVAQVHARHAVAGNLGVVVGATVSDPPDLEHVGGMILMPGVGAQGGTFADVTRIAGSSARLASPNVSRAVLSAGPSAEDLQQSVTDLTRDLLK